MRKWCLCVPTHGRKLPKILKMLDRDPDLEINFFVRTELAREGFYDELLDYSDRVHVHTIGYDFTELGLTRQYIMDWCLENDIKFCCMFDDGMTNVESTIPGLTISAIFSNICYIMEHDRYSDKVIGFSLYKHFGEYADGRIIECKYPAMQEHNYFLTFPAQAVILNVQMAAKHKIKYKSLNEVGFEDCAFFADAVKAGLIYCSRKGYTVDGVVPNERKPGGSHTVAYNSIEDKYDIQNARCMNYIGNMMGCHIEKRYRSFAKGLMSYLIFNTDFYREVLCDNPEANQQIIQDRFEWKLNDKVKEQI